MEEVRPAPEGGWESAAPLPPTAPDSALAARRVAHSIVGMPLDECPLCAPGPAAPGHPPLGPPRTLAVLRGEAAQDVGLPPQPGARPLSPPRRLSPLPTLWLSLGLGLQSSLLCCGLQSW